MEEWPRSQENDQACPAAGIRQTHRQNKSPREVFVLDMRASVRTTQGGIRRIRSGGCAAVGPLARNRPSDPDASTSRQSTKPVTEAEAIRLAQAGDTAAFEFLYHFPSRRVYPLYLRMV